MPTDEFPPPALIHTETLILDLSSFPVFSLSNFEGPPCDTSQKIPSVPVLSDAPNVVGRETDTDRAID